MIKKKSKINKIRKINKILIKMKRKIINNKVQFINCKKFYSKK